MISTLREHAEKIYKGAIFDSLPDSAVKRATSNLPPYTGRLILVAIGKAGYQMAKSAYDMLGDKIDTGVVITKYEHVRGDLGKIRCFEASHPVPDKNTLIATRYALGITEGLCPDDLVLFLVSGGGSALFEQVDCSLQELQEITSQLLACGASIDEINVIRKRLSNVKAGRFARHCMPAKVFAVVLSDVLGNDLSTIASGPACADSSTSEQALAILEKYKITPSKLVLDLLMRETPKEITNAEHIITGSTSEFCQSARKIASGLGYDATIVADDISCEASDFGKRLASLARENKDTKVPLAFIFGGETVVHLKGNGKGGRNQEIALSACCYIEEIDNCVIFSVGSDGTDGPTDSAGGICDHTTAQKIAKSEKSAMEYLKNNDSYTALGLANDLIFTGPTGTNVNDLMVLLIAPRK